MMLQVISLAGWVNVMYYIQDAHSFWDWIYFVALIIVSRLLIYIHSFAYTQSSHLFYEMLRVVQKFKYDLCIVIYRS